MIWGRGKKKTDIRRMRLCVLLRDRKTTEWEEARLACKQENAKIQQNFLLSKKEKRRRSKKKKNLFLLFFPVFFFHPTFAFPEFPPFSLNKHLNQLFVLRDSIPFQDCSDFTSIGQLGLYFLSCSSFFFTFVYLSFFPSFLYVKMDKNKKNGGE